MKADAQSSVRGDSRGECHYGSAIGALLIGAAVCLVGGPARAATSGYPDPAFGNNGKLITIVSWDGIVTPNNRPVELCAGVGLQSGGKIIVAGSGASSVGDVDYAVVRYEADGTLDPTFGDDGVVLTDLGFPYDWGFAMTLQSDDKIIVTGVATVRYNADGSLDTSFDGDGSAAMPLGGGRAVAVQADGKIVVLSAPSCSVVRYNADGSLDTSFDGDGVATTTIGFCANGWALGLQGDGKIIVGGDEAGSAQVVRLNPDGSLDSSFDGDGSLTVTPLLFPGGIAVQDDGKILIGGTATDGTLAILRVASDGSIDPTFGNAGIAGNASAQGVSAMLLQDDGKVVTGGSCPDGIFCVARFNADGQPDVGFSGDGLAAQSDLNADVATGLALQADKKIIAAGSGFFIDFAVVRYFGSCGDTVVDAPDEECDDGNAADGDGCDSNCTITACGNGVQTAGELCDDGDSQSGDGCEANCTVTATACGDGLVSIGEQCDDANVVDGDGCSSTCQDSATPEGGTDGALLPGEILSMDPENDGATAADPVETSIGMVGGTAAALGAVSAIIAEASASGPNPAGYSFFGQQVDIDVTCTVAPCPSAAQPLALDFRIDASRLPAGVDENTFEVFRDGVLVPACMGVPNQASPDPCVAARQLFGDGDVGVTVHTSLASDWNFASTVCAPSPLACAPPQKALFAVKTKVGDPDASKLLFKWLKGTVAEGTGFGDPLIGTSYALCVYDDDALVQSHIVVGGGDCGDGPCWQEGGGGFGYDNKTANDDGIVKLKLKAGIDKAKILVKGKGANLTVAEADPLFAQSSHLTVQLVANSGDCWQAVFTAPAIKNEGGQFKDKSP